MTPREALSNLMAAITGDDVLKTGLYVGTLKQHGILQDSVGVLSNFIRENEKPGGESDGEGAHKPASDNT